MKLLHVADGEATFKVVNVSPDYCEVDGEVVPFDIEQTLEPEKVDYAPHTFARGKRILHEGSLVRGVVGNAGKGVLSEVATDGGDTLVTEGTPHFFVGGKKIARHGHQVQMNVKHGG